MNRRRLLVVGAAVAVVAVPLVAYGVLAVLAGDAPAPASLGAAPDGRGDGAADGTELNGEWVVADVPTNFAGYRVRERLGPVAAPSDAVGRTSEVGGRLRIEDGEVVALDLRVDVASLDSGSPRRDEFVRDEALLAAEHPEARFAMTDPVDLGDPEPGEVVDLTVTGDLTLRGESREVGVEVQARWNGSTLQAAASTQIQRGDFGIDVSSGAGFNIDEAGTVELELTFAPAGAGDLAAPPSTLVDSRVAPTQEGEVRPPCSNEEPVPLDPPVLVAASHADAAAVAMVDGRQALRVVQPVVGLTGGAAWSPDGRQLVTSSSGDPAAPRALAVVPAAGTPPPRVLPGLSDVTHPDWGPDDRIVFVRHDGEDSDLWVVGADGGEARRLVATPGADSDPRWSPDGRTVVFTTSVEGSNQDVVAVAVDVDDPGDLRTVAGGPGYEYTPSFAPGGDEVLFVRDGSVYAVGLDGDGTGTGERRLTDGPSDVGPELSPDGRRLAFVREGSLFVAGADGDDPTCVPTGQAILSPPRWRPDLGAQPRNCVDQPAICSFSNAISAG